MAACCILYAAVAGFVLNCRGLYFQPVAAELGCPLGAFTAYQSFYGIAALACLPIVNRAFDRCDIRAVLCGALVAFFGASFCMGLAGSLWQFYLAGAVEGAASAFLVFTAVPYLVNRWFLSKRGFVLGMSAMLSGLTGSAANLAGGAIIDTLGWRASYMALAAAGLLVTLPAAALVLRRDPAELGLTPYGQAEVEDRAGGGGKTGDPPVRVFVLLFMMAGIWAYTACYVSHISSYATTLGLDTVTAASLVSVTMFGNLGGKLLLGGLNERLGVRRTCTAGILLVLAALIMLNWGRTAAVMLWLGAFFCGASMAMITVQTPLVVGEMYGREAYGRAFSRVTIATTLMNSFGSVIIGGLFSLFGSYRPCYLIGSAVLASCLIWLSWLYRWQGRR